MPNSSLLRFFPFTAWSVAGLMTILLPSLTATASGDLHEIESVAECTPGSAAPSAPPAVGDLDLAVYPPNKNESTLVDIGLFIIDVSQVDAVENTFRIQALLDLVWCDPRLAFDSQDMDENEKFISKRPPHEKSPESGGPTQTS